MFKERGDLVNDLGYFDMEAVFRLPHPFIFVNGGRGTGKTYGGLYYILKNKLTHFFVRRTQSQYEVASNNAFSPYTPAATDLGLEVSIKNLSAYSSGVFIGEEQIGLMGALSTFGNVRGFSGSAIEYIFFDEWIKEPHQSRIKEEGELLLNLYETVNRNRELQGRKPTKMICCSNSLTYAPPLWMDWDLVETAYRLRTKTKEVGMWTDDERGICIIMINQIAISQRKKKTALYIADAGRKYSGMALDNAYNYDDLENVVSRNLKEYTPLVRIGDIQFYRHRSKKGLFYASPHLSGGCPQYSFNTRGIKQFRKEQEYLRYAEIRGCVEYETYTIKKILTETVFAYKI